MRDLPISRDVPIAQPKKKCASKLEDETEICSNNCVFKERCSKLENVVEKMIQDNKKLQKIHREELRWREKKELGIALAVGLCAMMYVVVALATRGFV